MTNPIPTMYYCLLSDRLHRDKVNVLYLLIGNVVYTTNLNTKKTRVHFNNVPLSKSAVAITYDAYEQYLINANVL